MLIFSLVCCSSGLLVSSILSSNFWELSLACLTLFWLLRFENKKKKKPCFYFLIRKCGVINVIIIVW